MSDVWRCYGRVCFADGAAARAVVVRLSLVGIAFTRDMVAESTTDADGRFEIRYQPPSRPSSIEISVRDGDRELPVLGGSILIARAEEQLELLIPTTSTRALGYVELLAALGAHVDDITTLTHRDVVLLAAAIGRDEKEIAALVSGARAAKVTGLPAPAAYVLARAGLPLTPARLAATDRTVIAAIVHQAVTTSVVAASVLEEALSAFDRLAARERLSDRLLGAPSSAAQFIEHAPIEESDRARFRDVFVAGPADATTLWERARDAGVSEEAIRTLRLQGQLAYLTMNHAPLTALILSRMQAKKLHDVRDLLELDLDRSEAWHRLIVQLAEPGTPAFIGGRDDAERLDVYLEILARRVREADQERTVRRYLARSQLDGIERELQPRIAEVLARATNRGLRLGRSSFQQHTDASADAGAVAGARSLHRLFALTNDPAMLGVMLGHRLTSAATIAELPAEPFVRWFGTLIGSHDEARRIHAKARNRAAAAFLAVTDAARRDSAVTVRTIVAPQRGGMRPEVPTLERLFGTVDFCPCEQCRSVLGPAAYFVDLLQFVNPADDVWSTQAAIWTANHPDLPAYEDNFAKPYVALLERRPDLVHIPLTCANANTVMPYIDLVNELLEQRVVNNGVGQQASFDTGNVPSEDLVAEPQHAIAAAYDVLAKATYPMNLPFDLPLETIRGLLEQERTPLWRLRASATTGVLEDAGDTPGLLAVWREQLGLCTRDTAIFDGSVSWWELYGFPTSKVALDELRNAKALARRLDVSYVDLAELWKTGFINRGITTLATLRRLGLDPATAADFVDGTLTANERAQFMQSLALVTARYPQCTVAWLREAWSREVRVATFVIRHELGSPDFSKATITTFTLPSPASDKLLALSLWRLNLFVRLRTRLGWTTQELDTVLLALVPGAAAAISEKELEAGLANLVRYLAHVVELEELAEGRVTREEIVTLWRDVPTLGIESLYRRTFLDAVFDDPAGSLAGGALAFSIHAAAVGHALQISDADRDAIFKTAGVEDPRLNLATLSLLMRHRVLARVLDTTIADCLQHLVLASQPLAPLVIDPIGSGDLAADVPYSQTLPFIRNVAALAKLGFDAAALSSLCRGSTTAEDEAALVQAIDQVFVAIRIASKSDSQLAAEDVDRRFRAAVIHILATQLAAPESLVTGLVGDASLLPEPGADTALLDAFQAVRVARFTNHPDVVLTFPASGRYTFALPADSSVTIDGVPLQPGSSMVEDIRAGEVYRLSFSSDDVSAVTITGDALAPSSIAALEPVPSEVYERLGRAVRLLMKTTRLCARLNLTLPDVRAIASQLGLASLPISPTHDGGAIFAGLVRLATDRARAEPAWQPPLSWAAPAATSNLAASVRTGIKARYSRGAWRSVARVTFDKLRRRKRDALVAYVLHQGNLETREQLYDAMLLDPSMEPPVMATRIQMATASVQQFVRACMTNREPNVPSEILDADRWSWMSRYRMWEANRKIFLWPENWLDPELRDDKSHLFRTLEAKLLQSDISTEVVEEAMHEYLKQLESIARLEVITMYQEVAVKLEDSIMHVIARTQSAPHRYYHRSCDHGMWSPWEPIGVDVDGKHLALVKWRDRLHLFWLSFMVQTETASTSDTTTIADYSTTQIGAAKARPIVALQLNWIERVKNAWSDRAATAFVAAPGLAAAASNGVLDAEGLFVHVEDPAGDPLEIHVSYHTGGTPHMFRLVNKLSAPELRPGASPPARALSPNVFRATKLQGTKELSVTFMERAVVSASPPSGDPTRHRIITPIAETHRVLTPTNPLRLPRRTTRPQLAMGRVFGYEGSYWSPPAIQHVIYRGIDGHIYDLFGEGTRNEQPYWYLQDLTETLFPAPGITASGEPDGWALQRDPSGQNRWRARHVITFVGNDKRLYIARWVGDVQDGPGSWTCYDVTDSTEDVAPPVGRSALVFGNSEVGVVYRTSDDRLWSLRFEFDDTRSPPELLPRQRTLLTVTPESLAASEPSVSGSREVVVFRSESNDVVTNGIGGPNPMFLASAFGAPRASGNPVIMEIHYGVAGGDLLIAYKTADNMIAAFLWKETGSWSVLPMPAHVAVAGDIRGWIERVRDGSHHKPMWPHLVYRSTAGHIHHLWEDATGWHSNDITSEAGPDTPVAATDPSMYRFTRFNTQHVMYTTASGELVELRRSLEPLSRWRPVALKLASSDVQDAGPLLEPFFYEDDTYTFYVEPRMIQRAAHEWRDYIIPSTGVMS